MSSIINSASPLGIQAHLVNVEVEVVQDRKGFFIVGLPDITIRESGKRIITALNKLPINLKHVSISVNLAPATLKKEGALFDLPIAIGILQSISFIHLKQDFIDETIFVGELSFDGSIKPIKGALVIATDAIKLNKKRIILPQENAHEAALCNDIEIIGIDNLQHLISYINKDKDIIPTKTELKDYTIIKNETIDFKDVKGQYPAKKALQIAAAGRHNILFSGPPGSGKTMLAKRLLTIMPPMQFNEIIETTKIYSISGNLHDKSLIIERPFRSPHHSSSQASLLGGGINNPVPGELSLAHNGILFLDEFLEFRRNTLEALRQPLESKVSEISRVNYKVSYPCDFLLIAALNPCPCGYLGDKKVVCKCNTLTLKNYKDKLSGPLSDRIDIKVFVEAVNYDESQEINSSNNISSEELYKGVQKALNMQLKRFGSFEMYNSKIAPQHIEKYCILSEGAKEIMKEAFNRMGISMRSYHKILKVARTIADIDESELIEVNHIKQAIIFKS